MTNAVLSFLTAAVVYAANILCSSQYGITKLSLLYMYVCMYICISYMCIYIYIHICEYIQFHCNLWPKNVSFYLDLRIKMYHHWNSPICSVDVSYPGWQGVDRLSNVIHRIRNHISLRLFKNQRISWSSNRDIKNLRIYITTARHWHMRWKIVSSFFSGSQLLQNSFDGRPNLSACLSKGQEPLLGRKWVSSFLVQQSLSILHIPSCWLRDISSP